MPVRVKTADGAVVEGEVDGDLEGYIPEAEFQKRFAEELGRRSKSLERKALEKALEDETFRTTALERWGINLAELAKGGELNAEKLREARAAWEKEALHPLKGKYDEATNELTGLRNRMLEAEIIEAARAVGVKESYLKPLAKGAKPLFVASMLERFAFDAEQKGFFERNPDGEGFAYSTSGKAPYRTVAEAIEGWATDKANAEYLEDRRSRGPGMGTPGTGRRAAAEELAALPPAARIAEARARGLT